MPRFGDLYETSKLRRVAGFAVAVSIAGIGICHRLTPESNLLWHDMLQHIYAVPVSAAGLFFGWRGGLGAACFAISFLAPDLLPAIGGATGARRHVIVQVAEAVDLLLVALVIGVLADVQQRHRNALEDANRSLGIAHRELKDNFEVLKRSERLSALGQLSAGIAHEIRNPLASISGATGILERNQVSPERRVECLKIIGKETQRLENLLSSFLAFARPRAPEYQTVSPTAILDPVIALVSHGLHGKAVSIERNIEEGLPDLDCDPEQLQQVVLNLLINAMQAMRDGGEVVVSASKHGDNALISVRDGGCGITPEQMDKIFDPFFTTKETGTGLGLSVAHQIVTQHGGSLKVRPNSDRGVTFLVTIPLRGGQAYAAQAYSRG
ncbi:MAG: ATP-binding protein [Bryobacteraceae bacterium]|nr:ATP-binding protein [Bryobacteraceae bacterium]